MSFKHQKSFSLITASGTITEPQREYTAEAQIELDVAFASSDTDKQVTIDMDVSTITSVFAYADQPLKIETNDGSTPAETINLKKNIAYHWDSDSYDTNKFATDLTDFYLTPNSPAAAGTFKFRCIYDPTP